MPGSHCGRRSSSPRVSKSEVSWERLCWGASSTARCPIGRSRGPILASHLCPRIRRDRCRFRTAIQSAAVFAAGFCVVGAQTGANALAAECYPHGNSVPLAWAGPSRNRSDSARSPDRSVGGMLLSFEWGMKRVFWAAAVPALIAAAATLAITLKSRQSTP